MEKTPALLNATVTEQETKCFQIICGDGDFPESMNAYVWTTIGTVDVYISTKPRPGPVHHMWKIDKVGTAPKHLTMEGLSKEGRLYVVVYGVATDNQFNLEMSANQLEGSENIAMVALDPDASEGTEVISAPKFKGDELQGVKKEFSLITSGPSGDLNELFHVDDNNGMVIRKSGGKLTLGETYSLKVKGTVLGYPCLTSILTTNVFIGTPSTTTTLKTTTTPPATFVTDTPTTILLDFSIFVCVKTDLEACAEKGQQCIATNNTDLPEGDRKVCCTDCDKCKLKPCFAGGSCKTNTTAPDGFTCTCPAGTTGVNCHPISMPTTTTSAITTTRSSLTTTTDTTSLSTSVTTTLTTSATITPTSSATSTPTSSATSTPTTTFMDLIFGLHICTRPDSKPCGDKIGNSCSFSKVKRGGGVYL